MIGSAILSFIIVVIFEIAFYFCGRYEGLSERNKEIESLKRDMLVYKNLVEQLTEKPLYRCDPDKNISCSKKWCYTNGGECKHTTHLKYAMVVDDKQEAGNDNERS